MLKIMENINNFFNSCTAKPIKENKILEGIIHSLKHEDWSETKKEFREWGDDKGFVKYWLYCINHPITNLQIEFISHVSSSYGFSEIVSGITALYPIYAKREWPWNDLVPENDNGIIKRRICDAIIKNNSLKEFCSHAQTIQQRIREKRDKKNKDSDFIIDYFSNLHE